MKGETSLLHDSVHSKTNYKNISKPKITCKIQFFSERQTNVDSLKQTLRINQLSSKCNIWWLPRTIQRNMDKMNGGYGQVPNNLPMQRVAWHWQILFRAYEKLSIRNDLINYSTLPNYPMPLSCKSGQR